MTGGNDMKFSDLSGVMKKTSLTIDTIENPFEHYYIIRMNIPDGMN